MSIPLPLPLSAPSPTKAAGLRVVLYEGTGTTPFEPQLRLDLVTLLLAKGYSVTVVRPGRPVTAIAAGTLVVLGHFNETMPAQADGENSVVVYFRNMTGKTATDGLELVSAVRGQVNLPEPGKWKPWFPVIDYDRCTNCMQCLSFCLFDVYGVNAEKQIQVQNNNKCKTDCPACSRVCPEVAILFPKYRHGPINGDVVSNDDIRRENMKVDISSLLGGDIYAALRDRNAKFKSRFAKERDSDKALEERQKCLVKLGEKLDIPPEVFASLPSLDQIQTKAAEASAKAQAILADQQTTKPTSTENR
jgi:Pyruvate/2-oxoacid:ferredoxin oxidoreductase delta subunit